MMAVDQKEKFAKSYFWSKPSFFEIFKMDKISVFYIAVLHVKLGQKMSRAQDIKGCKNPKKRSILI